MPPYDVERAHYRIHYPPAVRPVFVPSPGTEGVPVMDCSERGLRFRTSGTLAPAVGTRMEGTVRFRTGPVVEVWGTVVRVRDEEAAIHLEDPAIPWRVLLQEQLFLRKRYPHSV